MGYWRWFEFFKFEYAICFDTESSSLSIAGSFTISAWFETRTTGATQAIITKGSGKGANYFMDVTSAGKVQISFGNGSAAHTVTSPLKYADGTGS